MKEFPEILSPKRKDAFQKLNKDRLRCYLRRDIYEHIISHEENEYFSLDEFNKRINNIELTKELVKDIIPELEKLGWNCKTSYGGTGLFIYSTPKPPSNCFEDEF
jgi:hypothetical protein